MSERLAWRGACVLCLSLFACSPDGAPAAVACADDGDCDSSEFCDFPEVTCGAVGTCVEVPRVACGDEYCPVTGCDGNEYDNECEAHRAGVDYAFPCSRGEPVGSYVIDHLEVAMANPVGDPQVVAGMNLDGLNSEGTSAAGCRHRDYTSPAPDSEMGVDSQYGLLFTGVAENIDHDFGPAIAEGRLLLLLEVRDTVSDVQIDLYLAATVDGAPPRLEEGRLAPGQAFRTIRLLGRLTGETHDGRTRAGPGGLFFPILPGSSRPLPLDPAYLYADLGRDGIARGVVGGGFLVEDAVPVYVALGPEDFPESIVRSVGEAQADLAPDADGFCTRISSGWTFTAVPAAITR